MFSPQEGEGSAGCWREGGPRKRQERQKAVATEAEAMARTRVSRGQGVDLAGRGPRMRLWWQGDGACYREGGRGSDLPRVKGLLLPPPAPAPGTLTYPCDNLMGWGSPMGKQLEGCLGSGTHKF